VAYFLTISNFPLVENHLFSFPFARPVLEKKILAPFTDRSKNHNKFWAKPHPHLVKHTQT